MAPDMPSVPTPPPIPNVPAPPAMPNLPDVPAPPAMPDMPSVPAPPAMPDMPSVPAPPAMPNMPSIPAPPAVPNPPAAPNTPAVAAPPAAPPAAPTAPATTPATIPASTPAAPSVSVPAATPNAAAPPAAAPAPRAAGNKAFLEVEGGAHLPCLFNPESLSVSRSNTWQGSAAPGRGVPTLRYEGASSATFSLNLFFDTTDEGQPVTKYTGKLLKLMEVDTSLPGSSDKTQNARPPWVVFHWGDLHSFKAVIESLTLSFTYFSSTGIPLRAKVDMSLKQYQEELAFGPQNPTSGTPYPHRVHRVQPGETLDRIAAMHFGDSTLWRRIADGNGIEDPLALRPGQVLAIPELT